MKKIIIAIVALMLLLVVLFTIFPKREENNKTKIRLADTALTSRTYMISYKQYISKWRPMKYAI